MYLTFAMDVFTNSPDSFEIGYMALVNDNYCNMDFNFTFSVCSLTNVGLDKPP